MKTRALLLTLLTAVLSVTTFAQAPTRAQLQKINARYLWESGGFGNVLYMPLDTAANAEVGAKAYKNGIEYTKDTLRWRPTASGGTFVGDNMANKNLDLTGDRTHNGKGFYFKLDTLAYLRFMVYRNDPFLGNKYSSQLYLDSTINGFPLRWVAALRNSSNTADSIHSQIGANQNGAFIYNYGANGNRYGLWQFIGNDDSARMDVGLFDGVKDSRFSFGRTTWLSPADSFRLKLMNAPAPVTKMIGLQSQTGDTYTPVAVDMSNFLTGLHGDVNATGPGDALATLSNTGVIPGTYTNLNAIIDAKGRILSAANGVGGVTPGDTTNKWVNTIRRRSGTDTVELFKNGSWQFAYKDSLGVGSGLKYIYSSTAPTGLDTGKMWVKTPAIAGVYDVYTHISNTSPLWQRFGWLSIDGFFSPLPPINVAGGGQSNMGGIYSGGDTARVPGILAFTSGSVGDGEEYQTHWEQAAIGKSPFFGNNNNMAFQFAKNIRLKENRIVRIVLTYKGGIGLSAWLCGTPHYLLDTLRNRLDRSGIDTLQAFLWHHGESNGCANLLAGGYYKDMQDFYDTLCVNTSGFLRNVTQFIAGETGGLDAANRNQQFRFTEANGAIRSFNHDGNINTASVPSSGLSRCDDTHFCGTALDSMGLLMYGAYKDMPHTIAYEQRQLRGNFDTTYERLKYDEADYLLPASGGGFMYKYYKNSFAWSANGVNTISIHSDNTVAIDHGYTFPGAFATLKVNGGGIFQSGSRNLLLSYNFNADNSGGGLSDNVVLGNYVSSWTGAAGQNNTLLGNDASYYTGRMPNNTVAVGYRAGYNFTPNGFGDYNTLVGTNAGFDGLGSFNTIVGGQAGQSIVTNNATIIGYGAGGTTAGAYTAVGYNAIADSNYQVVLGDTNVGQLKIGKLRFKINSIPVNGDVLKYNSSTSIFELGPPNGDGNGIYTGSGSLPSNITVTGGANGITFNSTRTVTDATVNINNTSNGRGLAANSTSGIGVHGSSTNSVGVLGISTNSTGIWAQSSTVDALYAQSPYTNGVATFVANPSSTNTVHTVLNVSRSSTSAGADGIAGAIDFNINNSTAAGSMTKANQLISQLTAAAAGSEVSRFTIKGVNSGAPTTVATFDGDGSLTTTGKRYISTVTSSAGTLTIGNAQAYFFNGSTTTWTLPPVSGTTGLTYILKNIGSGSVTLNADSGSNEIYSTSAVNTYTVTAGSSVTLISNGTYFTIN